MPDGTHRISEAIDRLKAGDKNAAAEIWKFASPIVLRYALRIMRGQPRAASNEEDVALSSFMSLCRGVAVQKFPRLDTGKDLLRVICTIAWCKANDHRKRAANRHGDFAAGESSESPLSSVPDGEPSPQELAENDEQLRKVHSLLGKKDPILLQITELRVEGYTISQIAEKIGRSEATVKRKLERIESILREEWIK